MISAIDVIIGLLIQLGVGGASVQRILTFVHDLFQDPAKTAELWEQIKGSLSNVAEPTLNDLIAAKQKLRPPIGLLPADDEE